MVFSWVTDDLLSRTELCEELISKAYRSKDYAQYAGECPDSVLFKVGGKMQDWQIEDQHLK